MTIEEQLELFKKMYQGRNAVAQIYLVDGKLRVANIYEADGTQYQEPAEEEDADDPEADPYALPTGPITPTLPITPQASIKKPKVTISKRFSYIG